MCLNGQNAFFLDVSLNTMMTAIKQQTNDTHTKNNNNILIKHVAIWGGGEIVNSSLLKISGDVSTCPKYIIFRCFSEYNDDSNKTTSKQHNHQKQNHTNENMYLGWGEVV